MRRRHVFALAFAVFAAGAWGTGPPASAEDPPGTECADCHAEIVEHFQYTEHARLVDGDWFGNASACSSCHGDAEEHAMMGDPEAIRGFPGKSPEEDSAMCLGCHTSAHQMGAWRASAHALAGMSCIDCHDAHHGWEKTGVVDPGLGQRLRKDLYEGCYECHGEVRAQIHLPSRHPLQEGHMNCGSCHDVHGAYPQLLASHGRVNDLCYHCHPAQQGPFVFQHDPVEEDCLICHSPHGAVYDNLLVQTEPFMCLQCHEGHFHAGLESPETLTEDFSEARGGLGQRIDEDNPQSVWSNPFGRQGMKRAFLTKCTQCHPSVHGTDGSSQGVSGGGKNLTR